MGKRIFSTFVFLGLMLVLAACSSEAAPPENPSGPNNVTGPAVTQSGEPPVAAVPVVPPSGNPDNATPPQAAKSPVPYDPTGLPYSINSTQTPAPLVLSNFTVSPQGLRLFETCNASVVVTNTGSMPMSYEVTLRIRTASGRLGGNIFPSNTQQVDLAAGESKTVNFRFSGLGNGSHIVYIDQLWDRVTVDSQV